MDLDMSVAKQLHEAISGTVNVPSMGQAMKMEARVTSVSDGIWVSIDGGADRTPVKSTTVDVSAGDAVTVEIIDGSCLITGNLSRAATSQQAVNMTVAPVRTVAVKAQSDAKAASKTADSANSMAHLANDAASTVSGDLGDLERDVFGYDVEDEEGNVTHSPGAIDNVKDAIGGVSIDVDSIREDLDAAIEAARKDLDEAKDELGKSIKQNNADILGSIETMGKLSKSIDDVNEALQSMESMLSAMGKWSKYDDDGVTLGKINDTGIVNVMKLAADQLGFYVRRNMVDDVKPVAAIIAGNSASESLLAIGNAEIDQTLKFGGFKWQRRGNGNMSLMWAGDE